MHARLPALPCLAKARQGVAGICMAWFGTVCLQVIIRVIILEGIFSKLVGDICIQICVHVRIGHGNANNGRKKSSNFLISV